MGPRIDELDRAILGFLRENARMPCAEMARRLGHVSARTVSNRIKRLRRKGIITITAAAVPSALGYTIAADVYIEVEPLKVMHVAEALVELDTVVYVAVTTGDADLSIQVHSVDTGDLQRFVTEKVHAIPGVRKTKAFVITQVVKQSCDWPFPEALP